MGLNKLEMDAPLVLKLLVGIIQNYIQPFTMLSGQLRTAHVFSRTFPYGYACSVWKAPGSLKQRDQHQYHFHCVVFVLG